MKEETQEIELLNLTEEKNALDNLEKAAYFIKQTDKENIAWKWVILSIYSSLYGFAICALKGANPQNVIRKNSNYLIKFGEAIDRCQKEKYMDMTTESKVLSLTKKEENSIEHLSDTFRNNFVHYKPKNWGIEISLIKEIIEDCLDPIYFLALESGNYTHLEEKERDKIEKLIKECKEVLNK